MGLFTFSNKVGQGLPLWLASILSIIRGDNYDKLPADQQIKSGYESLTLLIGSKDLYVCSGHYEKYGEDSFQPIKTPSKKEEFFLMSMNCPFIMKFTNRLVNHIKIYLSDMLNLELYIDTNKVENFMD